jgi:hypothetical protein
MKTSRLITVVALALGWAGLGLVAFAAQPAGTVAGANLRQQALNRAQATLNAKPAGIADTQINPFNPAAFNELVSGAAAIGAGGGETPSGGGATSPAGGGKPAGGPRSDRDLLIAIAGALKPGGSIKMGGGQILLMGVKKIKVGDPLSVTFEGAQYNLQVTAINPTNFTLRYNGEEYTRPIK